MTFPSLSVSAIKFDNQRLSLWKTWLSLWNLASSVSLHVERGCEYDFADRTWLQACVGGTWPHRKK